MRQIDRVDRALIRELQTDARQSNVALAKKVGLTEGAVRRRVDALLAAGAIRIAAVADPSALGLQRHAIIGLRCESSRTEELSAALSEMRELSYVYETAGTYDIIVVGFFASDEQLRLFLTRKLARLPGVLRTETFYVMKTLKRSFRWGEAEEDGEAEDASDTSRTNAPLGRQLGTATR